MTHNDHYRSCRKCGCTDERACPNGCWWVEADLCSRCAVPGDGMNDAEEEALADLLDGLSPGELRELDEALRMSLGEIEVPVLIEWEDEFPSVPSA